MVLGTETMGDFILVNMHHELMDAATHSEFAAHRNRLLIYFENLAEWFDALPDHRHIHSVFCDAVYKAVWRSKKVLLMRQGRATPAPTTQLVVMKSLAALRELIEAELPGTPLSDFVQRLPDSKDTSADRCRKLADMLNAFGSGSLPIAKAGRTTWYTREADCRTVDGWDMVGTTPNDGLATDLRNWLGLGRIEHGMPLFAFRSRLDASGYELRRPMSPDAIDQPWFKYKADEVYHGDDWGRARNLSRIIDSDGDGGPEAVGLALYAPADVECLYVGRPTGTPDEPDAAYATRLASPRIVHDTKSELYNILWPLANQLHRFA